LGSFDYNVRGLSQPDDWKPFGIPMGGQCHRLPVECGAGSGIEAVFLRGTLLGQGEGPQVVTITAKFELRRLLAFTNRAQKNLVFSAVQGINDTAKLIQAEVRKRAGRVFTIRKEKFIRRQLAIIKPFASVKKGQLSATISVGQKPRLLLGLFERGGERKPAKGKQVAIPITGSPARPTAQASVPKELQFKSLRLKRKRNRATGKSRFEGQQKTFTIPGVGVLQRTAAGVNRLLYLFASRTIRLKPRLGFLRTAEKIGRKKLDKLIASKFRKSNRRK